LPFTTLLTQTTPCVTPTSSRPFPFEAIALAMLGATLASTEGVVALFAYACDTLSRPEGIIDHTVDDCPRDLERWALTKAAETMSRLNAPRPEQSPARPDGRILRRPPAH
jgi:hypothetical protein